MSNPSFHDGMMPGNAGPGAPVPGSRTNGVPGWRIDIVLNKDISLEQYGERSCRPKSPPLRSGLLLGCLEMTHDPYLGASDLVGSGVESQGKACVTNLISLEIIGFQGS